MRSSEQIQGYLFVLVTMIIWGAFTLLSRLNAAWHIGAWDITALRFGIAALILFPVLVVTKKHHFLWHKESVLLALIGGVAYCITCYSAFLLSPAAHAAIFLNGMIPITTAIAAFILNKQAFDRNQWWSVGIMLLSIGLMSFLISRHSSGHNFGFGDVLFFMSATLWGTFSVLLRKTALTGWEAMCSVAIWSSVIYIPIYLCFLPHHLAQVTLAHLIIQTLFHGLFVVIIATLAYAEAIKRLGAFKAGSLITLAPFLAAIIAVPLLNEPLSPAIVCGLIGMAIGALQPWRLWVRRS